MLRLILASMLVMVTLLVPTVQSQDNFQYSWEMDETPQGSDRVNVIQPVEVILTGNQPVHVPSHSASLQLMSDYSVYLSPEWNAEDAYKLLRTFESAIPQRRYHLAGRQKSTEPPSLWRLSNLHIHNDIAIGFENGQKIVTIADAAFVYAEPLLAEIEGVRGRFFSKRLHRAVVRSVTDNGADRNAIKRILRERYALSVDVPDYRELTRHTTNEHAGRFSTFKNEELMSLVSILEEFPTGMLKTPGLKYLVRRLDGTPNPRYPFAPALAWPSAGYIEFMEGAFKGGSPDYIHRLILHEKAHFLWAHLFDEQLKQDWIKLGGWYQNPDNPDRWSTTEGTTFVSAYAHDKNPNEDMAESISYYIVNPDKLRSHAPAKYQFIQDRIMHGTRYISQIRKDLTFEVYNLYPDYVYPGRIIRVDIQVSGEPEADKQITIELEIHNTGDLDTARGTYLRIFSEKGTFFDMWLSAIGPNGERIDAGHILRGTTKFSRYRANGYWGPSAITIQDAAGNERHQSAQMDFGWKLYINNALADYEDPTYVKNSMRLSLSQGVENGRIYHIINASCQVIDDVGINGIYIHINDANPETYSRGAASGQNPQGAGGWGGWNEKTHQQIYDASVNLTIPDYYNGGKYVVHNLRIIDRAENSTRVYFSDYKGELDERSIKFDEPPATIEVPTINPDSIPPELDVNRITIKAEPTRPEDPNGETEVDITFRARDNISGYKKADLRLRDPHGGIHYFTHTLPRNYTIYFPGDPTVYRTYHEQIVLPVGSIPGTWGLAEMVVHDKAHNFSKYDFTEIVRFEVDDTPQLDASILVKFDMFLPKGMSLIHIPLKVESVNGKPQTIESVSDLYTILGGAATVNFLTIYDPQSQKWLNYYDDRDKGTASDMVLTDDFGILATMKSVVSIRLSGVPLGIDGSSSIALHPGTNLVGVPLNDSRIIHVSDLLTLEGIVDNVSVIIVLSDEFKVVGQAGDPGDIPITGGQAFILTAQEAATVPIAGDGWD